MKLVAIPLAAVLGFLGLVFVVGYQGSLLRIVVGVVIWLAAGAVLWLAYLQPRPSTTTVVQKIDLTGDVSLQDLTCKSCGGTLSSKSLTVQAGAIFVHCEYCGASYQMEEQPKW